MNARDQKGSTVGVGPRTLGTFTRVLSDSAAFAILTLGPWTGVNNLLGNDS